MEANNQYNFGGHPTVSTNSGLKPSSGESLYTNGSSVNFSQQGKNLNGDLNVNGVTTVGGTSVASPHPPTSYSRMSSHHHQHHHSSLSYDYAWGQPQYGPAAGAGRGAVMHHKQGHGAVLPQHFQGHTQYQANGGLVGSRQPPASAPPNVTLTGGQYWNRVSPTQQQAGSPMVTGYSSHGGYGAYQGQVHPSMAPAQHQHHPQTHLHHHNHHHQQHHQQQQQQQQHHYGMVPNGMSYYQIQAPPLSQALPLSQAPPHSQTLPLSQPPSHSQALSHSQTPPLSQAAPTAQFPPQAQIMPTTSQNFTPPCHSPQHHSMSRVTTGSPLPSQTSPIPVIPPSSSPLPLQTPSVPIMPPSNSPLPLQAPLVPIIAPSHSPLPLQAPPVPIIPPSCSPLPLQTPSVPIIPPSRSPIPLQAPPVPILPPLNSPLPLQTPPVPIMPPSHSPLPLQAPPVSIMPPSMHENGAALVLDNSLGHRGSQAANSQGHLNEMYDGVDSNYSRVESVSVTQMEGFSHRPASFTMGAHGDFVQRAQLFHSEAGHLVARQYKDGDAARDPALPVASAPPKACAPLRISAVSVTPASATITALSIVPVSPMVPAPPTGPVSTTILAPSAAPELHVVSAPPASSTPPAVPHPEIPVDAGSEDSHFRDFSSKQAPTPVPAGDHEAVGLGPGQKEAGAVVVCQREPITPVSDKSPETLIGGLSGMGSRMGESVGKPQSGESSPTNCWDGTSLAEESRSVACGGGEDSAPDETVRESSLAANSLADDSWVTEDSEEAGKTWNEDVSKTEVTTDTGSAAEDSQAENGSLTEEFFNEASQSAISQSCTFDSSTSTHSAFNDCVVVPDSGGQDAPDSTRGCSVVQREEELSIKDTVQAPPTPAISSTATPNTGFSAEAPSSTQTPPLHGSPEPSVSRGISTAEEEGTRTLSDQSESVEGQEKKVAGTGGAADDRENPAKGRPTLCQEPISSSAGLGPSHRPSLAPLKPQKRVRKEEKKAKEGKRAKKEEKRVKKGQAKGVVKGVVRVAVKGLAKGAAKGVAKLPRSPKVEVPAQKDEEDDTANGEVQRRRIATEEQVKFPLLNGWRREVRVRRCESRLKGETWYYSPCGKRMKQFPEVIKYLSRHPVTAVTREHFSFSPRMPVGDFYEERETPQGVDWFLLADEEVPSMIMAITGRRGRPPNPDRVRPRARPRPRAPRNQVGPARRPGRPPKVKMVDLLSKVEARLLKKLEAQDTLSEEEKEKLMKMKKMKRKARNKRKEDAKNKKIRQEKRKAKLEKAKEMKEQEEREGTPKLSAPKPTPEPKKQRRRKLVKVEEKAEENGKPERAKRGCGARSKAKALAKAKAEAEAQAQAAATARRQAERRAQAQRRLEERKRQQLLLEELKKPTEDMCITDHKPLPLFSRVPGLVLSGQAFSHCLMVVEFLHSYGKVVGLQLPQDVPSLCTLQEGLLGLGDSQGELQDLLVKLVQAALRDPGLPPYYQSVKILGEKLVDLDLNRSSVTEGLRIFLESRGFEADICSSLRTKPFQALAPDAKAAMLAFLVDELNGSNIVISEIDKTLENMAIYRKNKWGIEGKLRRLKAVLARRTGRSEVELCLEERRRSARVVDESLSLEESMVLQRGARRVRLDDIKLSEGESPTTASIPELERQIDKLTKRQVFFRKKLLQCSHIMRAVSLGQDRYRRRYWVLPHLGGVLVEGAEEILGSGDVLVKEEESQVLADPHISPVKSEPTLDPPSTAAAPPQQEDTALPGTVSLMNSPRGRGRPRKIKPEVELHLRTAKNRRRRRSSKAGPEESADGGSAKQNGYDITQSAFLAWLGQSQGTVSVSGVCSQDSDSVKEMAERRGQWFNLLPKMPCDASSLSQPSLPNSTSKDSATPSVPLSSFTFSPLQMCSTPFQKPSGRRRRSSGPALTPADPAGYAIPASKRRGRPPSKLLQEIEQKYFIQLIPRPIPKGMVRGWWRIRDPGELSAVVEALHPRGIREKALHKHLSKHSEYLAEVCAHTMSDPVFLERAEPDPALTQAVQGPWLESVLAMEADLRVLQWVEDLEQRVLMADLQLKVPQMERIDGDDITESANSAPQVLFPGGLHWGMRRFTLPEADSTRPDLEYHDHVVEAQDDWLVKTKREWSGFLRLPNNPLDLAMLRLAALECSIERRYLKEPLWNLAEVVRLAPLTPPPGDQPITDIESVESEITPRLRLWRQALDRCRSSAQLSLCLLQLERSIAWERSVIKVTCLVCRKGDNDECLLLCDGCDRGCHMYCLRPQITQIPEGDWFCPVCVPKENGDSQRPRRSPKRKSSMRKRRVGGYGSGSSDEDHSPKRDRGMTTRQKESSAPSHARFSGEGASSAFSPSKRRRMVTRNQPDLTFCEIILMEMESHADAWPFLEPVNPRLVLGYRRIIKHPMDFLTMRERLLQGGYCSCEEFAADAQLVFDNCQLFNEDTSEVGLAGQSMRRFFECRWAEFYQDKDQ